MNETKYLKLQKKYGEALNRICTSNLELIRFFKTAAHNFRLGFNNAVVTYAQEPEATALLTFDQWKIYGRVPKRHSKSILLFDNKNQGRYQVVFDYSKTTVDKRVVDGKSISFFKYDASSETVKAVKQIYNINPDTATNLSDVFLEVARNNVNSFISSETDAEESKTDRPMVRR